jgi:hypothetical protein
MKELFKYRSNEGDHSFDILKYDRLYFSTQNQFNDPFDASIPFDYSEVSKEYLRGMAKRNAKGSDRKSKRIHQKELYRKFLEQKSNFGSLAYQSQVDFVNQTIGIFCLSSEPDNLLLWAYYSNSHKGFCIGFDFDKLKRSIDLFNPKLFHSDQGNLQFEPVTYSPTYPRVNPETLDELKKYIQPLKTKSHHWAHEKEYRIIFARGPRKTLNIGEELYSRVILGVNSNLELKNEITAILKLKKTKIPLFKAELSKMEYGIRLNEVKY